MCTGEKFFQTNAQTFACGDGKGTEKWTDENVNMDVFRPPSRRIVKN